MFAFVCVCARACACVCVCTYVCTYVCAYRMCIRGRTACRTRDNPSFEVELYLVRAEVEKRGCSSCFNG